MKTALAVCLAVMFVLMAGCIGNPGEHQVAAGSVVPTETTMDPVVVTQSETPTPTPTEEPVVGITTLYAKGDFGFDNVTFDLKSWSYSGDLHYPFNPHTITLKCYDKNKFPIGKYTDIRTINWHIWAGSPEDVRKIKGDFYHTSGYLPKSGEWSTRIDTLPEGTVYVSLDVVTNRVN